MATKTIYDAVTFIHGVAQHPTDHSLLLRRFSLLLRSQHAISSVWLQLRPKSTRRLALDSASITEADGAYTDEQIRFLLREILPSGLDSPENLRNLISKPVLGPFQADGIAIPEEQAAILFYCEFESASLLVVVVADKTFATPAKRTDFHQFIELSFGPALDYTYSRLADEVHARRRQFYSAVLSTAPDYPGHDLQSICDTWKELLNASSVWLWIFNQLPGEQWEVLAVSSCDEASVVIANLAAPVKTCVAEYCNRIGAPEFVNDITKWKRSIGQQVFEVVCKDQFAKLGYKAIDCIPLPFPEILDDANSVAPRLPLRAAICAHYIDAQKRRPQPQESLTLMAKVSALALVNSYQSEQREILFTLNGLGHEFLSLKAKHPNEIRKQYLDRIIQLIRQRLNVSYVSIFYKDTLGSKVTCLATTGLWNANGQRLTEQQVAEASYRAGWHRTGMSFLTGKTYVQRLGQKPDGKFDALFRETDPLRVDESQMAWIIYPILAPRADTGLPDKPRCIGVIRCTGNQAPKWAPGSERNFDPVQIQTLGFIAREIGPPLETMAAQVSREMAVNYIKHDLYAPVEMVSESLTEIEEWYKKVAEKLELFCQSNKMPAEQLPKLREYVLHDLRRSLVSLEELVHRLDPDPAIIDHMSPSPTLLEGDIMARLRAMLHNYAKRQNGMSIRFEDFDTVPPLLIDRFLIERVFTNLIINAIKYGKAKTEILVEARVENDGIYVAVSNSGNGIPSEEKDLIFQGQFRGQWARKYRLGAGFGLKISKAIMELHGGSLRLVNANDPTVFEMFFPIKLRTNLNR